MRDYRLYLDDIYSTINKIGKYTQHLTCQQFQKNDLIVDAVIRNLEIIGEASKNIPPHVKKNSSPDVKWNKISAMRNILVHEYFGIDHEILWDIVTARIPKLKEQFSDYQKKKRGN